MGDENRPFFSVIIPVYNVENYIKQCLDAVLAQTFNDFEVILVNDGSTDSSGDICRTYKDANKKIILIEQENRGLLLARRAGLRVAHGKYIVHVDSDDSCRPNMLQTISGTIAETQADLVVYNKALIDLSGNVLEESAPVFASDTMKVFEGKNKNIFVEKFVEAVSLNSIWAKCAAREIIDVNADYEKYGRLMMGEDTLQSIPLIEKAEKIVYIPDNLYLYRVNPEGMSRSIKEDYVFHFLSVRKRMLSLVDMYKDDEGIQKRFWKYYVHTLTNYLLKSTLIFESGKEYKKFRQKVKEQEIRIDWKKNVFPVECATYVLCSNGPYFLAKLVAKGHYKS